MFDPIKCSPLPLFMKYLPHDHTHSLYKRVANWVERDNRFDHPAARMIGENVDEYKARMARCWPGLPLCDRCLK